MAGNALYFRHSDIVTGTWSLAAGAALSGTYPVTNLGLILPFKPKIFWANSGTCTPRLTTAAPVTVEGVAIIGHNLAGVTVTLTSGAGLNTTLVVPANTLDGMWTNAFKDLRGLGGLTSDQFNAAISGHSSNVKINKIFWILSLRQWNVRWGIQRGIGFPNDRIITEKSVPHTYEHGVRNRPFLGEMTNESDRIAMEQLFADARGNSRVWGAVLDSTVNDVHMLQFVGEQFIPQLRTPGTVTMSIDAIEMGLGKAL